MKLWSLSLALMAVVSAAFGDQLVLTGQVKEGSFQGFENGKFLFQTAKGRFTKEQASRINKLVLANPMKASYVTSDGKEEPTVTMTGFDKRKFAFTKDGKEVIVGLPKMKTIEVSFDDGSKGTGVEGGNRYPIPQVNVDSFADGDITPAQQAALDKFKAAKKIYDEFLGVSTDMVKEMDKMTGGKREERLNQLRLRKNDEQPLKKSLVASYRSLADAFPEQPDDAAKPAAKPANGAKEPAKQTAKVGW